jgi:WD40 repeat protein
LASASYDKNVRLWNAKTGTAHKVLEGHTDFVTHADVSSDGRIVASGADDGKVRLWDAGSGEQLTVLEAKGESTLIKGLWFSNSSRFVIVGSGGETVRLWNIIGGKLETTLKACPGSLRGVAISSGGQFVATRSSYGTVQLWDMRMGDSQPTLEGHWEQVIRLVLTLDVRFEASVAQDETVCLRDVQTGKSLRVLDGCPFRNEYSFTPDGSYLNIGSRQIPTGFSPSPSQSPSVRQAKLARYTLEAPGNWAKESSTGTNVLWLPPDRRPCVTAEHDNIIAVGHRSGRVTFLAFNTDVELCA